MQCPVGGPGCNTKHAGWASRYLFEHERYSVGKSMVYMCRNPVCPFFNKTMVGWDPLVLQHLPGYIARSWQSAYTLGPKSGYCTRLVHEASRNGPLGTTMSRMAASHSELEVERYHQLHEQYLLHHHHYWSSRVASGLMNEDQVPRAARFSPIDEAEGYRYRELTYAILHTAVFTHLASRIGYITIFVQMVSNGVPGHEGLAADDAFKLAKNCSNRGTKNGIKLVHTVLNTWGEVAGWWFHDAKTNVAIIKDNYPLMRLRFMDLGCNPTRIYSVDNPRTVMDVVSVALGLDDGDAYRNKANYKYRGAEPLIIDGSVNASVYAAGAAQKLREVAIATAAQTGGRPSVGWDIEWEFVLSELLDGIGDTSHTPTATGISAGVGEDAVVVIILHTALGFSPVPAAIKELLVDPTVDKIGYSAGNDKKNYRTHFGFEPTPIIDAYVCVQKAEIPTNGGKFGLEHTVPALLGKKMLKDDVRSSFRNNMLSLTKKQITYLAADAQAHLEVYVAVLEVGSIDDMERGQLLDQLRHDPAAETMVVTPSCFQMDLFHLLQEIGIAFGTSNTWSPLFLKTVSETLKYIEPQCRAELQDYLQRRAKERQPTLSVEQAGTQATKELHSYVIKNPHVVCWGTVPPEEMYGYFDLISGHSSRICTCVFVGCVGMSHGYMIGLCTHSHQGCRVLSWDIASR